MTFLNPIYLWSLLGVFIPIAIHLWSRRKVVTVKVGSIKLLHPSEPRQTSTVRLNELWLLLLRILIILLLGLLLSKPQLLAKAENSTLLYIIEPSLLASQKMEGLLEGLPSEAMRVLATGFPEVENYDVSIDKDVPNYWQLAQGLKELPADSLVVFTNAFISGVLGKRPTTSTNINWIVLDSEDSSEVLIEAELKRDSLNLLNVSSDWERTRFSKINLALDSEEIRWDPTKSNILTDKDTVPLLPGKTINILLVHTDSLQQEVKYINTVCRVVSRYLKQQIVVQTTSQADSTDLKSYDASIWLGTTPKENSKSTRLLFKPDALATGLIQKGDFKNEFYLTRGLNSENIVSEHLAEELVMILNGYKNLTSKVEVYDKRVLDVNEIRPNTIEEKETENQAKLVDIRSWIWVFLALLISIERITAKFRKQ